jgi:hypothetical protein
VNIIIDDKERTQLEQKRKIIESRKKKDGDWVGRVNKLYIDYD